MSAERPAQTDEERGPHEKYQGPYTEEQLYVAVTRAWCKLPSRQLRRERPMRGYVCGWHFVSSVERSPVNLDAVIRAVFEIVSPTPSAINDDSSSLTLRIEKDGPLDPVAAWWRPIDEPEGLGIHYVELSNGTIALLTLAPHDHQPDPGASQ